MKESDHWASFEAFFMGELLPVHINLFFSQHPLPLLIVTYPENQPE